MSDYLRRHIFISVGHYALLEDLWYKLMVVTWGLATFMCTKRLGLQGRRHQYHKSCSTAIGAICWCDYQLCVPATAHITRSRADVRELTPQTGVQAFPPVDVRAANLEAA